MCAVTPQSTAKRSDPLSGCGWAQWCDGLARVSECRLGTQLVVDSAVVRDALAARVNDPHDDTRAEAIVALAQRRDKRAFPAVLAELTSGCEGRLVLQAAKLLADDRLLAPLIDLRDWWELDRELLEEAIRWCDPALRAADETAAAGVVDAVQHAFPAAMPTSRLLRAFSERSAVSEERELVIEWAGANGRHRTSSWWLEGLLTRASHDDPLHAVLADIAAHNDHTPSSQ